MTLVQLGLTVALIGSWLVAAIGWIWPRTWIGDLCIHASDAVAACAAVCGVVGLVARSRGTVFGSLVLAVLVSVPTCSHIAAPRDEPPPAPHWMLATINAQFGNPQFAAIDAWLRDAKPDIVAVQEMSPGLDRLAQHVRDLYPHQHAIQVSPRALSRTWGMGVWSKFPIVARRTIDFDGERAGETIPWLEVTLDVHGRQARVVVVHAMVPRNAALHALRDESIAAFAERVGADAATILAGDFNATARSSAMRDALATTGLRHASRGFSSRWTWRPFDPRGLGWPALDLDHVLVGDAFGVVDWRIGPAIGSDHRPVVAGMGWR